MNYFLIGHNYYLSANNLTMSWYVYKITHITIVITVYTSQLQEVSPSLPATIMMDEEFAGSGEEELSSPHEYTLASPTDMHDMNDMQEMHDMHDMHDMHEMQDMHEMHDIDDMQDLDEQEQSPQSPASQDANSDIEVDV